MVKRLLILSSMQSLISSFVLKYIRQKSRGPPSNHETLARGEGVPGVRGVASAPRSIAAEDCPRVNERWWRCRRLLHGGGASRVAYLLIGTTVAIKKIA